MKRIAAFIFLISSVALGSKEFLLSPDGKQYAIDSEAKALPKELTKFTKSAPEVTPQAFLSADDFELFWPDGGTFYTFGFNEGDSMALYLEPLAGAIVKRILMYNTDFCGKFLFFVNDAIYDGEISTAACTDGGGWIGDYDEDGNWVEGTNECLDQPFVGEQLWPPFGLEGYSVDITDETHGDWVDVDLTVLGYPDTISAPFFIDAAITEEDFTNCPDTWGIGAWGSPVTPYHGFKFYDGTDSPTGDTGWFLRSFGWYVGAVVEYVEDIPPFIEDMTILRTTISQGPREVSATITDFDPSGTTSGGVAQALLWYSVNSGVATSIAMTAQANTFSAEIPGELSGNIVEYWITATDNNGNTSESFHVTYEIFKPVYPSLLINNGTYDDGTVELWWLAGLLGDWPHDIWNVSEFGPAPAVLYTNYETIVQLDNNPTYTCSDVPDAWLDEGNKNFVVSGDEWMNYCFDGWNPTDYGPGDFPYDYMGVDQTYPDMNYSESGDQGGVSRLIPVEDDLISGVLFDFLADSLLLNYDPNYEIGASNWLDGADVTDDATVAFWGVSGILDSPLQTDGDTVASGIYKQLTNGSKTAYFGFDALSLNTVGVGATSLHGAGYHWVGVSPEGPIPQALLWMDAYGDVSRDTIPRIVYVDPDSAFQGQALTVSITGWDTRFSQGSGTTNVWFSQGSPTINADSFSVHSNTLLTADFQIPSDANTGLWDVHVLDDVDGTVTLENGFAINPGDDPNDDYEHATPLTVDGSYHDGEINPAGDVDWYSFSAIGGQTYVLETHVHSNGLGTDTYMHLFGVDGTTQLAEDDDGGEGLLSRITWMAPSAGTYFVMIRHYSSEETGFYSLSVSTEIVNLVIGLSDYWIDDDEFANSWGNSDGVANPGEFLEVYLTVTNEGASGLTVSHIVPDRSFDSYVSPRLEYFFDDWLLFNTYLSPGDEAEVWDDFDFYVHSDAPSGHILTIPLSIYDNDDVLVGLDTLRIPVTGTDTTPPQIFSYANPTEAQSGEIVHVFAFIWEAGDVAYVAADIESPDENVLATVRLYDDGTHGDGVADDRWFTGQYTPNVSADFFVDILAIDGEGNSGELNNGTRFTTKPFVKANDILLVADDGPQGRFEPLYRQALGANGFEYDIWQNGLRGTIDSEMLNQYVDGVVIWYMGWTFPTLDSTERAVLGEFIDLRGKLFITDQDLGWWLVAAGEDPGWFENYLHAYYVQDDVDLFAVNGVEGDPITDGMYMALENVYGGQPGVFDSFWPDEIDPFPEAAPILHYDPSATPGVTTISGDSKEASKLSSPRLSTKAKLTSGRKSRGNYDDFGPKGISRRNQVPMNKETPISTPPQIATTADTLSSGTAGLRVDNGLHKLVYLSFGFEAISDSSQRAELLHGIIEWLEKDVPLEPTIEEISDVGNDQGRQVRVGWTKSRHDGEEGLWALPIAEYSLWRRVDPLPGEGSGIVMSQDSDVRTLGDKTATVPKAAGKKIMGSLDDPLPDGEWDFIVTVPAIGSESYNVIAPTLADSTIVAGMHWSVFAVVAHTDDPITLFVSDPDSGYSVDNLVPHVPGGLIAAAGTQGIDLSWEMIPDEDFNYYALYRSTEGGFDPDAMDPYATTVDTFFVDREVETNVVYYYRISAFDFSGNEGEFSEEVSGSTMGVQALTELPTVFSLAQNYPNPFNPVTTLRYGIPERAHVVLTIYDILGRPVRTLVRGVEEPGFKTVVWSGTNDVGETMSAGVYLYRMQAGNFTQTRKMILLK